MSIAETNMFVCIKQFGLEEIFFFFFFFFFFLKVFIYNVFSSSKAIYTSQVKFAKLQYNSLASAACLKIATNVMRVHYQKLRNTVHAISL